MTGPDPWQLDNPAPRTDREPPAEGSAVLTWLVFWAATATALGLVIYDIWGH